MHTYINYTFVRWWRRKSQVAEDAAKAPPFDAGLMTGEQAGTHTHTHTTHTHTHTQTFDAGLMTGEQAGIPCILPL